MESEEDGDQSVHALRPDEEEQLDGCLNSLETAWDHACQLLEYEIFGQLSRGEKPTIDTTAAGEILPILAAARRAALGWVR